MQENDEQSRKSYFKAETSTLRAYAQSVALVSCSLRKWENNHSVQWTMKQKIWSLLFICAKWKRFKVEQRKRKLMFTLKNWIYLCRYSLLFGAFFPETGALFPRLVLICKRKRCYVNLSSRLHWARHNVHCSWYTFYTRSAFHRNNKFQCNKTKSSSEFSLISRVW